MLPEAKLDILLAHHASLEAELLGQLNSEKYVQITRELAELNPLIDAVKTYRAARTEIADAESLLKIVLVKSLCRAANVERVEAGPKGAVITLRNNEFANPQGLVSLIADPSQGIRLKPDQKLVFSRDWPGVRERLTGVAALLSRLAQLARKQAA